MGARKASKKRGSEKGLEKGRRNCIIYKFTEKCRRNIITHGRIEIWNNWCNQQRKASLKESLFEYTGQRGRENQTGVAEVKAGWSFLRNIKSRLCWLSHFCLEVRCKFYWSAGDTVDGTEQTMLVTEVHNRKSGRMNFISRDQSPRINVKINVLAGKDVMHESYREGKRIYFFLTLATLL